MRILLSNDDGYAAAGIEALFRAFSIHPKVSEITLVAPDRNRSGASNSLTLTDPLRVRKVAENQYAVNGTPTDCVHLALTGLLQTLPDIVISGINAGANLGDDTLYSGTVAAATEGRYLGFPAMAVSLAGEKLEHYATAVAVTLELFERLLEAPLSETTILNVNVPDVPLADLKGVKVCRLGHRHKAEPVIKTQDPRGLPIYWIGPAGGEADNGPGTDFAAIREGFASLTPLKIDLTDHQRLSKLQNWLESSPK